MNIIEIDYQQGKVKSDFYTWEIVSNNDNKFLLLQRNDNGRYRAAEADVARKQMFEIKEISYRGPNGDIFAFDPETGIVRL